MELMTPSNFEVAARQRRQRRTRPCDACRKNKTKCVVKDGKHACLQCQTRESTCEYNHAPPERKQRSLRDGEKRGESNAAVDTSAPALSHSSSPMLKRPQIPESRSEPLLGLCSDRFAELYGLGSDMEPILMVGVPRQSVQR